VTTSNDDIFKELEEYVQEKKQTNKYLDDISDIDGLSNGAAAIQMKGNKERMSKKYKEMMAADKDLVNHQKKKEPWPSK